MTNKQLKSKVSRACRKAKKEGHTFTAFYMEPHHENPRNGCVVSACLGTMGQAWRLAEVWRVSNKRIDAIEAGYCDFRPKGYPKDLYQFGKRLASKYLVTEEA